MVADDSTREREWYRDSLDKSLFALLGAWATGRQLLQEVAGLPERPDVVVLDGKMPLGEDEPAITSQRHSGLEMDRRLAGLHTAQEVRAREPGQAVLITSNDPDRAVALGVDQLGAGAGYVIKDSIDTSRTLHDLVLRLLAGDAVFDPVTQPLLGQPATRQRLRSLTPAERRIYLQLVQGKSNQAIGRELGIQPSTVAERLTSIYAKLQLAPNLNQRSAAVRDWYLAALRDDEPDAGHEGQADPGAA